MLSPEAWNLTIEAGLLAFPDLSPSHHAYYATVADVINHLVELQLRGQLPFFTGFPFNTELRSISDNQNRGKARNYFLIYSGCNSFLSAVIYTTK